MKATNFARTIRAVNSPADDLKVTAKSMFAVQPSLHVEITRHGVAEKNFSIYEVQQLSETLSDLYYQARTEAEI